MSEKPVKKESDPIYVNYFSCKPRIFEFILEFAHLKEVEESEEPIQEELIQIVMSPMTAKAVFAILGGHIKTYEEKVGPIPIRIPEEESAPPSEEGK